MNGLEQLKLQYSGDTTKEGDKRPPYLSLNIPFTLRLGYTSKTLADYKQETLEVLDIKQGQILEIIESFASSLASHEYSRTDLIGEFIEFLSEIGQGVVELSASVRDDFIKANIEHTETKVLDLSKQPINKTNTVKLTACLEHLIKSPSLSESLRQSINQELDNLKEVTEVQK